jgi:hypothetical protein
MKNLELKNDISYLIEIRNDELERFNELIKTGETDERVNNCINSLLRIQKRVKLAEAVEGIYRLVKNS